MSSEPEVDLSTLKSYSCHCPVGLEEGRVLLFYRYYANTPKMSLEHQKAADSPKEVAACHRQLAEELNLTGKLRIAREGFNITIAGTISSIEQYISFCCSHWSFSGIDLTTSAARKKFFKPTTGCSCVCPSLSIKVCAEITPMAVTDYSPTNWSVVGGLEPPAWHAMIREGGEDIVLLDVRNHYESSVGYFVDGAQKKAIKPQLRRFSQLPQYIKRRRLDDQLREDGAEKKMILSYCTGGIRCEKASRFLEENLPVGQQEKTKVFTLQGGIVAYMSWADQEIKDGRMTAADSLFRGRNYVFDGRGSIGLEGGHDCIVGRCIACKSPTDAIQKCKSASCNLELVVCTNCMHSGITCCQDCRELDIVLGECMFGARSMCQCERDREASLWADSDQRKNEWQGSKPRKKSEDKDKLNIRIQKIQPKA